MVKRRRRPNVSSFVQSHEFFKIYLPDRSSQLMQIPPAFIKYFNGTTPDKAILKDLGGKFWHVDLEEVENGLFIKNGWQGFVNDHSLQTGDFLVFRYDGNSSFTVRIFGKNGCKKEEAQDIEEPAIQVKIEEETEAEQTCCKPSRICKCSGEVSQLKSPRNTSKLKRPEKSRGSREVSRLKSPRNTSKLKRPEKSRGSREVSRLKSPRNTSKIVEKRKVFEPAESVLCKNPYFIASLRHSSQSRLNIPKKVLVQHGIELDSEVVFHNQNGRQWPVRISYRENGRVLFSKGWMDFWKENNLRIGGTCKFEFARRRGRNSKIRVQILHRGARTPTLGGCRTKMQL